MSSLEEVGLLQAVIIVLLCEPQKRRRATLGWIIAAGAVYAAIYYLGPGLIGLLYEAVEPIVGKFGWLALLALTGLLLYAVSLVVAFLADRKQNRAVRAGSKEAFDKRVKDLMSDQHLSFEEATGAATRVRDEKRK